MEMCIWLCFYFMKSSKNNSVQIAIKKHKKIEIRKSIKSVRNKNVNSEEHKIFL